MDNKLPFSLSEITLDKYISWNELYGKKMDNLLKSIVENENKKQDDVIDFTNEFILHEFDYLTKYYSFHTNNNLESINSLLSNQDETILDILKESAISHSCISREINDISSECVNLMQEFEFNNRKDYIIQPLFNQVDFEFGLTVEQFELGQNLALIFSDLQDGNTIALYELCAAYFRPKGVVYRGRNEMQIELMKSLPLHIALRVKKYISETLNILNLVSY